MGAEFTANRLDGLAKLGWFVEDAKRAPGALGQPREVCERDLRGRQAVEQDAVPDKLRDQVIDVAGEI